MKRIFISLGMILFSFAGSSQKITTTDTTKKQINLTEVVVSVNKWEQKLNEVPNKITKINKTENMEIEKKNHVMDVRSSYCSQSIN